MNDEQRNNLKTLALGLRQVPPHKFNMGRWGVGELDTESPKFDCNFAGCAIGWAPKLIPNCQLCLEPNAWGVILPCYGYLTGFGAVADYFGIFNEEAFHLFDSDEYNEDVTPAHVADRILAFLNRFATEGSKP